MTVRTLPEGWTRLSLGDVIAEFCNGGTPSTTNPEYWGGPIPWITGADITDGRVGQPRKFLTLAGVTNSATHVVPKGGLLIVTRTGVGKVAVAPYDIAISQDITGALPKEETVNSRYLYWWLTTNSINLKKLNQGTSINGIVREDLGRLLLLAPPTSEQRAIATILDSIDEAIERTEQVIAATERVRQALLQDLLTHGVPGWHKEWKHIPGIGTIPGSWEVVRLGEVATHIGSGVTPRGGKAVYEEKGVLFIRSQNVHFNGLRLDDVAYISETTDAEMARSRVYARDVLLNITGASIGRVALVPDNIGRANVNQHVCIVRTNASVLPGYLVEQLSTVRAQSEINLLQAGQSRQGLNYEQVRRLTLPLPTLNEQERILQAANNVRRRLIVERQTLHGLTMLKASVSDALLTGRVRVGGDADD